MTTADIIKQFIVTEFIADASSDQLDSNYDLRDSGVIDSLGLLRLIAWIESRFGLPMQDIEIVPDDFRTVQKIVELIEMHTKRSER